MQTLAQGIVRAVEQPLPLGGLQLHVRVSLGIAVYPFDGLGAEGLMEHADHGMYAMKRRSAAGVLALA
jgi:GGDEF domain-containing protein